MPFFSPLETSQSLFPTGQGVHPFPVASSPENEAFTSLCKGSQCQEPSPPPGSRWVYQQKRLLVQKHRITPEAP